MLDQPSPAFLAAVVSAVKQALAAEQTPSLPSTLATSFASSVPMAASLVRVRLILANSIPKPQAWQPLALVFHWYHRLFPLPRSKVGLILLYLLLLLHLPHR